MKRVKLQLKDLKPNPFKKHIRGGKLDEGKIVKLVESINENGYWDQLVCRQLSGEYQIAFGHHRVAAGKRALGAEYETSVQVVDYNDAAMLRAMADENSTNETESVEAQVDTVVTARTFLEKNQQYCRVSPNVGRNPLGGRPHVCGSARCIELFLGTDNWPNQRVIELLRLAAKLHPTILKSLTTSTTHPEREANAISYQAAVKLCELPQQAQKDVFSELRKDDSYLPVSKAREIVTAVKPQLATLKGLYKTRPQDAKQLTATIATIATKAVLVTQAALRDINADATIKSTLRSGAARPNDKPALNINEFAVRTAVRINKEFSPEFDPELFKWLDALVKYRAELNEGGMTNVVTALTKLANRAQTYRNKFETEPVETKSLKGK